MQPYLPVRLAYRQRRAHPRNGGAHSRYRTPAHQGRPQHRGRRHGGSGALFKGRRTHRFGLLHAGLEANQLHRRIQQRIQRPRVRRTGRPRRRAGAVPVQSGTVGRFPRLLSAWRRHRPRSHRQRHHLLRRARHRHGNRTRLHRRERQAMRLRQCRMPGTLLLRQRHPRTTQRQPEHRSRMRDDDACAGLRSTVRQGERGRRDRDASDARCCPIRWVRRGHHHQRFQSDTHRSWRHHRASRPAVARRSHTSRARTHDPRNRRNTRITLSALPTDATVTGAAAVAITNFLEHPSMFFDVA